MIVMEKIKWVRPKDEPIFMVYYLHKFVIPIVKKHTRVHPADPLS